MVATKRITVDDLERDGVPDGFWELIDGRIVEVTPSGGDASTIGTVVTYLLGGHVYPRKLGRLYGADGGFVLYPGEEREVLRAADVAFVRADRVPPAEVHARFLRLPPDLVVEVVSLHDAATEVAAKARFWIDAGVRLAWIVHPRQRSVTVYEEGRETRVLGLDQELDGGDVLPGFRVSVSDLFH